MAGDGIEELLVERLTASGLDDRVADLVIAALLGPDALAEVLTGAAVPPPVASATTAEGTPAILLGSIEVTGFRGVAGTAKIGFTKAPGLTLVVGRNGSGKSTFAEAAELVLTGTSTRWAGRAKAWQEGWSNLHHEGARAVEVRLHVDGDAAETTVRRQWAAGSGLSDGTTTAQRPGGKNEPLSSLGYDDALTTWRPFLSYNELSSLLEEGPSKLHDAISAVLGLDEWSAAEALLTERAKALDALTKTAKTEADRLRGVLATSDDERATAVVKALPKTKAWDLDAVEAAVIGGGSPEADEELGELRRRIGVTALDLDAVEAAAVAVAEAAARVAAVAGTDAGRAQALAELLSEAVRFHEAHGTEACPVCGGALGGDWLGQARSSIIALRAEAGEADGAGRALTAAVRDARTVVQSAPVIPHPASARWMAAPDAPPALAEHLRTAGPPLAAAIEADRAAATDELATREDAWRPIAAQVAAWLPDARIAQDGRALVDDLKAAAKWLAAATADERAVRFAPIAKRVQGVWEMLRQSSNVSLDKVDLKGTRTQRKVELSVSVDGVDGAALSVMSQGELHALALSLFLPRATLPESPFRFLVIDDPVQAMDAARVDGLARALDDAGRTHQVIVFTHDERLPEAMRRLEIPARVLEVTRGERSAVTIRSRKSPVEDYLSDARSIIRTDKYPDEARRRVVPGLCRAALEAACADVSRRRLIEKGRTIADIDEAISRAERLMERMALALFGDANDGGLVLGEVNRRWGREAGDLIQQLSKGAHQLVDRDPDGLVADTAKLAAEVAKLR